MEHCSARLSISELEKEVREVKTARMRGKFSSVGRSKLSYILVPQNASERKFKLWLVLLFRVSSHAHEKPFVLRPGPPWNTVICSQNNVDSRSGGLHQSNRGPKGRLATEGSTTRGVSEMKYTCLSIHNQVMTLLRGADPLKSSTVAGIQS